MVNVQRLLVYAVMLCAVFSCRKDPPIYPEAPKKQDTVVVIPPPKNSVTFPGTYMLWDADMDFNTGKSISVNTTSIYYSRLNGSNIKRITTPPAGYNDYRASIAAGGTKIIFTRYNADKTGNLICTSNLDGSNFKTIVRAPGVDCASFSPDGKQIIYARPTVDDGGHDIFIANADGSAEKRLTTFADFPSGDCDQPRWAADGMIYFNTAVTPTLSGFFCIKPNGTGLQLMPGSIIAFLTLSPDGKLALSGKDFNLFISAVDGGNLTSLTNYTGTTPFPLNGACFTLDQKLVYLASNNKSSNQVGLYKVNADGTALNVVLYGYYEYPTVF